jgi:hypothetical protein
MRADAEIRQRGRPRPALAARVEQRTRHKPRCGPGQSEPHEPDSLQRSLQAILAREPHCHSGVDHLVDREVAFGGEASRGAPRTTLATARQRGRRAGRSCPRAWSFVAPCQAQHLVRGEAAVCSVDEARSLARRAAGRTSAPSSVATTQLRRRVPGRSAHGAPEDLDLPLGRHPHGKEGERSCRPTGVRSARPSSLRRRDRRCRQPAPTRRASASSKRPAASSSAGPNVSRSCARR